MKLLLIIYDAEYDEELTEHLNRSGIKAFSKLEKVLGKGKKSSPKMDSSVWPGFNSGIIIGVDEKEEKNIMKNLFSLSTELGGKGLKVFVLPVLEVI
ncbi:MAG: transcriptional regulator [Thermodesulfobacteriota bacterium]|nr:transcriptional regulator [Thermodesulfobacteriota bacterium]